jgi:hypothetical protein
MTPRTCYAPSKSYANYPAHPAPGQTRFNAALNLLNSHLSQHSLRNRCYASKDVGERGGVRYTGWLWRRDLIQEE